MVDGAAENIWPLRPRGRWEFLATRWYLNVAAMVSLTRWNRSQSWPTFGTEKASRWLPHTQWCNDNDDDDDDDGGRRGNIRRRRLCVYPFFTISLSLSLTRARVRARTKTTTRGNSSNSRSEGKRRSEEVCWKDLRKKQQLDNSQHCIGRAFA